MIKISVITPGSELINEECEFISASGDEGEIGILQNHVPVIMKITDGYVKVATSNSEKYAVIINGVLDFNNNVATIISSDGAVGETLQKAKDNMQDIIALRLKENKRKIVDFVEAEKELVHAIKEANASKL